MKKILSIVLVVIVAVSAVGIVMANGTNNETQINPNTNFGVPIDPLMTSRTFVTPSDWAKSDIEKAIALNIINVGGNYNFPAPITREEFCELIYNYCYNVVKEVDTVTGENKFTDTTNSKIASPKNSNF